MNQEVRNNILEIKRRWPQVWEAASAHAKALFPQYPTWFLDEVTYNAVGEAIRIVDASRKLSQRLSPTALAEIERREQHGKEAEA